MTGCFVLCHNSLVDHAVDHRHLSLELKVLADVGLLGMPNAGESTLITAMSHAKPRWLVINKIDLLAEEDQAVATEMLLQQLDWDGPVFEVSAATGAGTEQLGQAVMQELERMPETADV